MSRFAVILGASLSVFCACATVRATLPSVEGAGFVLPAEVAEPLQLDGNPTPSPEPSPAPSPVPSPDPSPVPSPDPSPVPSPDPSPVPSPDPSPVPSPDPSPVPSPDPSPVPSPDPSPVPSPQPPPAPGNLRKAACVSANAFRANLIAAIRAAGSTSGGGMSQLNQFLMKNLLEVTIATRFFARVVRPHGPVGPFLRAVLIRIDKSVGKIDAALAGGGGAAGNTSEQVRQLWTKSKASFETLKSMVGSSLN
jgi:hypothetical protein